jgi:hypothetical protein
MSVQCMQGESGALSMAAAILWLGALAWGLVALFRHRHESPRFRAFCLGVVGALLANSALHFVYGEETFLYALHFTPWLVVLAAGGFLVSRPRPAQAVFAVLICLCAVANFGQLRTVLTTHDSPGADARVTERLGPATTP